MTWEGLKVLWEPSEAGNLTGVCFGLVSRFRAPEESVRTVCTKGDCLDLSEGSFDTGDWTKEGMEALSLVFLGG